MAGTAASPGFVRGFARGVGACLAAALVVALIDIAQAVSGGASMAAAPAIVGLWLAFAAPVAIALGVITGGFTAVFGDRWLARGAAALRDNDDRDRRAVAVVVAVATGLVLLAGLVAVLAVPIVAARERQAVGALLLGAITAGAALGIGAFAVTAYWLGRRIAGVVPRLGGLPRTAVLLAAIAAGAVALTSYVVFTQLDWRVLGLGALVATAAVPVLALVLLAVAPRALARLPWVTPLALWPLAVGLAFLTLRGEPSREVAVGAGEHAWAGGRVLPALRARFDGDGDGYSTFFGNADCDDGKASVNPGAREVPGNGIDDNCQGGDRAVTAVATPDANPSALPTPPAAPTRAAPLAQGNVLFVMIDTLRGDRLGVAGYRPGGVSLTPRIDAFAAEATRFARAYAHAPNTPRSLPSMLGGRYPSQIKVATDINKDYPTVQDDNVLWTEALASAGLAVWGITSHFYFCDEQREPGPCAGFKKAKHSNIRQGATGWDNADAVDVGPSNADIASPRTVPRALAKLTELAAAKQRFGMFVHLFEPHSTYVVHPREGKPAPKGLDAKYDAEIEFVDHWFGQLLDGLAAAGLAETTAVILVSDHGEAFGAHTVAGKPMYFHGQTLYQELIHVPLMVRVPGLAPRVVEQQVELVDLAKTIVGLLGLPADPSWRGRDLGPALAGEVLPPRPVFAELLPAPSWPHAAKAIIAEDGRWKLYFRMTDDRYELYDLTADPGETRDRYTAEPAVAERLRAQLLEWMEVELTQ